MKGRLLATVLFGVLVASGGEAWAAQMQAPLSCAVPCAWWDINCDFRWNCCNPNTQVCGDSGCEAKCPRPQPGSCMTLAWDANDCQIFTECAPYEHCGYGGCEPNCMQPVCNDGRLPCPLGGDAICQEFACCGEGTSLRSGAGVRCAAPAARGQ